MPNESSLNYLVNAVTEISELLAAKDARIKELESQVNMLSKAGFYPFYKAAKHERESVWHKIDDRSEWRYAVSHEILCQQFRQQVGLIERY